MNHNAIALVAWRVLVSGCSVAVIHAENALFMQVRFGAKMECCNAIL
jgi:hypothetical protein